jgi:MoaA/NifB/PqqE/SkfB family radical SAM enzyme
MCAEFSSFKKMGRRKGAFIEVDVIKRISSYLEKAIVVNLHGFGEPLLHPGFMDIVEFVTKFDVMVNFFTHGNLLSLDIIDRFIEQKVELITISFSGSEKAFYEAVYKGGDFDKVLEMIALIGERKKKKGSSYPLVSINSLAFSQHMEALPTFVALMADRGVSQIYVKPLQIYSHTQALGSLNTIHNRKIQEKIKNAQKLAINRKLHLDLSAYYFDVNAVAEAERPVREDENSEHNEGCAVVSSPDYRCVEPLKTLFLTVEGVIRPCCFTSQGINYSPECNDPWRAESFQWLQEKVIGGEYPETVCGNCRKNNIYPRGFQIEALLARYRKWFLHSR